MFISAIIRSKKNKRGEASPKNVVSFLFFSDLMPT